MSKAKADGESICCEFSFTVAPASLTENMAALSETSAVYNGAEHKPDVIVDGLTKGMDYDVTYSTSDFTNAGTIIVTITGKGNYTGTVEKTYTIKKAALTITANAQTITYDQSITQGTDDVTAAALCSGDSLEGITLTASTEDVPGGTITPSAAVIKNSSGEEVTGNYAVTYVDGALTINKADQTAPAAPTAADEDITDTSITLTAIDGVEYRIGEEGEWKDSLTFDGLSLNTTYTFYARLKGDNNHNPSPASEAAAITTKKTMLDNADVTVSGTFTYNGTAQVPTAEQVKVVLNGITIPSGQYTIRADDNTKAGEAAVIITATADGNYSGSTSGKFYIAQAPLIITASDQEVIYGQGITTGRGSVAWDKLCDGDNLDGITLTAGTEDIPGGTITPSAAVIKNSSGEEVTGNYAITYVNGTLTVNRAEGTLTVPETSISKTFGDGEFMLICSTNGDGKISYISSNESVASVSADGNVLIKGAGEAVITVSLAEGANHTGGASQEITVTVAKAAAPIIINETRNYTYTIGSKGAVTIDAAEKLPDDRGETEYTVTITDDNGILSNVSVDDNGKLVYTVEGNKSIGDTAEVTVTARMANYESADFTVKIELTAQKAVELQAGSSISVNGGSIPVYGLSLSDLTWDPAVFVELGTDTAVEGTLAWKDGSIIPEAGTTETEWIFTPEDNDEYMELAGTVKITVTKVKPETEIPEPEAITYNPSVTLDSVDLKGGSAAWTVGGSRVNVAGTWGWQNAGIVPTVDNSGYTAVFIPADTKNYETVTETVSVTVAKAVPYIAVLPTAADITYGDTLSASALSGGTIQYGNGTGQAGSGTSSAGVVSGTFTWKEPDLKPAVADSGKTEYTVIFTPFDAANYEAAECKVTLAVQKVENAPNMPGSAMTAATGIQLTLADVSLAAYTGWEWENAQTALPSAAGEAVAAVARYTGEDKDNYENVTREVTVTMVEDTHVTIIPDKENDTRVVMYAGIREIPQALADAGFDTEEEILEALSRVVLQSNGYTEGNMVTYDIELQFTADGGKTWATATEENFPSEGLTITIPYPEGTSQSGYEFRVVHMFTHAMNGHEPGETEVPEVTNTAEGIRFTIGGLSPVTIAWKAADAASDTPGTGNSGEDNPSATDPGNEDPGTTAPGNEDPGTTDPGNGDPGTTAPGNEDPGTTGSGNGNPGTTDNNSVNTGTANQQTDSVYAPKTGDDRHRCLCILLLIASGAGTAAAAMAAKKKKALHFGHRSL